MLITACGGGGGGGGESASAKNTSAEALPNPTPLSPDPGSNTSPDPGNPSTVPTQTNNDTASILLPSGYSGDGENMSLDPNTRNDDNDSIYGAYAVLSSETLGTTVAGAVTRFADDRSDFFQANLKQGTVISSTASSDTADNSDADLYLYDEQLNLINASFNGNASESLTVPSDGNYYIEMAHYSGDRAKYSLNFSAGHVSNSDHALTLNGGLIPGELMVAGISLPTLQQLGLAAQLIKGSLKNGGLLKLDYPALLLNGLLNGYHAAEEYRQRRSLMRDDAQRARYDSIILARVLQQVLGGIVEPNIRLGISSISSNDRYASQQWSLEQIGVENAWQTTEGSSTTHVAVIDTGFLLQHRDLQAAFVAGWNYVDDNNNPAASSALSLHHGTHVAGIIAAQSNNGLDIAGIAPNVKIIPIKVMRPDCLCGSLYDALQGILWAAGEDNSAGTKAANPAKVINLSIDLPTSNSNFLSNTINTAAAAGSVVVWAAGNNSSRINVDESHSLKTPGLLVTAASGRWGKIAHYSNYGNIIDLIAPGGDTRTDNGSVRIRSLSGYISATGEEIHGSTNMQGTSQAAPHVSGSLALAASVWPNFSAEAVEAMLESGALTEDTGIQGPDSYHGHGRIDADKSVRAALQTASHPASSQQLRLRANPGELNFGGSFQQLTLNIEANLADIPALAVNYRSPGLTVTAFDTDSNGLGDWQVTLDRDAISDDLYQGVIIFQSGSQQLYVTVTAHSSNYLPRSTGIGKMLVEFLNPLDQRREHRVEATISGPQTFSFDLASIPAGDYIIRASSDLDNNGRYCELGEFCGYLQDDPNQATRINHQNSLDGRQIQLSLLQ
jgi:serine protease